jgi:hypothetical protein
MLGSRKLSADQRRQTITIPIPAISDTSAFERTSKAPDPTFWSAQPRPKNTAAAHPRPTRQRPELAVRRIRSRGHQQYSMADVMVPPVVVSPAAQPAKPTASIPLPIMVPTRDDGHRAAPELITGRSIMNLAASLDR